MLTSLKSTKEVLLMDGSQPPLQPVWLAAQPLEHTSLQIMETVLLCW